MTVKTFFDLSLSPSKILLVKHTIILFLFMISISLGVEPAIQNPSMNHKGFKDQLIASKDFESDEKGVKTIRRIKLYKTSFKYPLLRTEEIIIQDASENERSKSTKGMVGDHIIVKLKKGADEKAFEALNQEQGATIRKKMLSGDTFVIAFNGDDIEAFPKILSAYQKSSIIEFAEPDYIAHVMKKN